MREWPESGQGMLIRNVEVLSQDRYRVEKYTFDLRGRNGSWHSMVREVHWRGDSAVVLLYCPQQQSVVLTRQFRLPVFVNGQAEGLMIEVPGGLLEDEMPAECARREAEEETGFEVKHVEKVCSAYMCPALITERVHLFLAEYEPGRHTSGGGGCAVEGEDIQVMEIPIDQAFAMIDQGTITDGRTILLLLQLKLKMLQERVS
jgi:GDP-mannose pyrophosphatase NudK